MGLILKLGACALLLLYSSHLRGIKNFSISKIIDTISRLTLLVVGLIDIYVMFTNRLYDTFRDVIRK